MLKSNSSVAKLLEQNCKAMLYALFIKYHLRSLILVFITAKIFGGHQRILDNKTTVVYMVRESQKLLLL